MSTAPRPVGLDPAALEDACLVAAEGKRIAKVGVPYVLDGIVPSIGCLGMLVAFAKVGKTTFAQALGAAASAGLPFLGRDTTKVRVLIIAAEDPPEYTAWGARNLVTAPGRMTFCRRGVILNDLGLADIVATVKTEGIGLVLISSWQAVVRGLVRDENDNASSVAVVERVKAATRETGIPWLIDAHAGKGEDMSDDADPSRAMRGASAAAGACDYTLSLRYADGTFGTRRRLSGKGRFVSFAPMVLDFDDTTSAYTLVAESTKSASAETTWRLIEETGAVSTEPRTAVTIARLAGVAPPDGRVSGAARRRVHDALHGRDGVLKAELTVGGRKSTVYSCAPHMDGGTA